MAEYHVGCGAFDIYAGLLNKAGNMWTRKTKVTMECLSAAAKYLIDHKAEYHFEYKGTMFVMRVKEEKENNA